MVVLQLQIPNIKECEHSVAHFHVKYKGPHTLDAIRLRDVIFQFSNEHKTVQWKSIFLRLVN